MERKCVVAVLVSVFLLMLTLDPRIKGSALLQTTIFLDPTYNTAAFGQTFTVNVSVAAVTDLYCWEFKLFWDNTLVNCIKEVINFPSGCHWNPPNNVTVGPGIENDYNNTHGRYWKGLCPLAIAEPYPVPFDGNTSLVTLTFDVKNVGECALDLSDAILINSEQELIAHNVVNGYFVVSGPPQAAFVYSPKTPFVNQEVTFNASDSKSCSGEIISYAWNFGNGGSTVVETEPIANYVYTMEGTYLVILNVTDSDGLSSTISNPIEISGPCGPIANFAYSPRTLLENQTTTFDASVSELGWNGTQYSPIVTYEWNFGDGTHTIITDDPVMTHAFVEYGDYLVTLNITDTWGCWDKTSYMITVEQQTAVYVEPPYYYGNELGEVFTIKVNVVNIDDVVGFEFKLGYDVAILSAIDVALGSFLIEPTFVASEEIDNDIGRISFAAITISAIPAQGNGVLATITFEVVGKGLCIFDIYDLRMVGSTVGASESPQVITPTIRNVAIISATPSANEIYAGQIVNITVVAKNWGNTVEDFNITAYYDIYIIGTESIVNLTAGSEVRLTLGWNTTGVKPGHDYAIEVEASVLQDEISTADNVNRDARIRIVADLNFVDKVALFAPYIASSSIAVATIATIIYIKRRKKKQ
jgi:PKD repeat protein